MNDIIQGLKLEAVTWRILNRVLRIHGYSVMLSIHFDDSFTYCTKEMSIVIGIQS